MKIDNKVIAEQIKKGSFRKNQDGNTGKGLNNPTNQNVSVEGKSNRRKRKAAEKFPIWVIPLIILLIGGLVGAFFLWRWWRRWKARDIVNAKNN